jgi:hypothetical protein
MNMVGSILMPANTNFCLPPIAPASEIHRGQFSTRKQRHTTLLFVCHSATVLLMSPVGRAGAAISGGGLRRRLRNANQQVLRAEAQGECLEEARLSVPRILLQDLPSFSHSLGTDWE